MDDPVILLIIAVVVVLAVAALGLLMRRRRSSQDLRQHYGAEYERVVERTEDRKTAEEALRAHEERRQRFETLPLNEARRDWYLSEWESVQGRFVDGPADAVRDADRLVTELMRDRGYPMDDFEQRAEDLSVDHPRVVEHYRAAADIAARNTRGEARTEDLRQAMRHFRALFEALLRVRSSDVTHEREGR